MIGEVPRPAYVAATATAPPASAPSTADAARGTRRVLVVLVTLPGGRYEVETFDADGAGAVAPLATMPVPAGRYGMTLAYDGDVYLNEGPRVATYRVDAAGALHRIASVESSVQPAGAVDADGTVWSFTYVPAPPAACGGPWALVSHALPIDAEMPPPPFLSSSAIAGPAKVLHLTTGDLAVLDMRPDPTRADQLAYHIPEFRATPNCRATPFVDVPIVGQLDDIESNATAKIFTSVHLDTGATQFEVFAPGSAVPSRVVEPVEKYLFPYTKIAVDNDDDLYAPFATSNATAAVRDDGIAVFDARAGRKATPTRILSPTTWASRETLVRALAIVTPSS